MTSTMRPSWRPHPTVVKATAYAGCFVVIGAATWMVLQVLGRLSLVLFPIVLTMFLTRVLSVPAGWLRRRGWRPAPATAASLLGFLLLIAGLIALIAPPMVQEFSDLGPTLEDGLTEVEDWVVTETSLDVTRSDIQDIEEDVEERGREVLENSGDQVAKGAQVTLTALAGFILALILTFFAVKDGPKLQEWAVRRTAEPRRARMLAVARATWTAIGGYLRGSALLGIVEAIVIGGAMALAGSGLVLPVMLLTFLAAFVPLVGAILAGAVAVLVTLATGGVVQALIVLGVAIVVQQLDNDLLAPLVFGKSLDLHPAVILLSIAAGTALFGFPGTVLAVPVTAAVLMSLSALRELDAEDPVAAGPSDATSEGGASAVTGPPVTGPPVPPPAPTSA